MTLSSMTKLGAAAAASTVAMMASALCSEPARSDAPLALVPSSSAFSRSQPSQKQLAANMGRATAGALGYGLALESSPNSMPLGGELSLSAASGLEETALYDVARFANSLLRGSAVVQPGRSGLTLTETAVSLDGQPLFESYTSARDVESPATTLMARCTQIAAVAAQVLDAAGEANRADALFRELTRLPIVIGSVISDLATLTQVQALCRTSRIKVHGHGAAAAAVGSLATQLLSTSDPSGGDEVVDVLLMTAADAGLLEALERLHHSTVIVTDSDSVAELAVELGVIAVKVPSGGELTPLLMLAAVAQFRP